VPTLLSFSAKPLLPNYFDAIRTQNHSFHPGTTLRLEPDTTMLRILPQQQQAISMIVDFIHRNPPTFAQAIISYSKSIQPADIRFLSNSAIPSLFGFFATNEFISIAFPFFCCLIADAPHDLAISILTPFFCCPCSFSFMESVHQNFSSKFQFKRPLFFSKIA
jgi:hypothetical protein